MNKSNWSKGSNLLWPSIAAVAALLGLALWLGLGPQRPLALRIPGTDRGPDGETGTNSNPVLAGKLVRGEGQPSTLPGAWPQFRGPNRDGIDPETVRLARTWPAAGPRELWSVEVGEGYAGPAVLHGRVYLMDYEREQKQDALRCLSLDDGREIWRYSYPVPVKRNHGMSRTVPAVTEDCVVAIGPKCHVVCLNPATGELRWGLDLVRQYGATVPPWYAGQCPLIEQGAVILAPGGRDALLMAVEATTGKVLWKTPNPHGWKMTHSSITPMEFQGQRFYVYCANNGVVGVSAKDGALLWETTDWKISIATVPSPVSLGEGRLFLSGGYNAGSLLLQLSQQGEHWEARTVKKLEPEVFGATQHTPILYNEHLYGVRADNKFVCLTPAGQPVWASDSGQTFGLGPFVVANGLVFAVNDAGLLRLFEASPDKYHLLAQAQVLKGRESWAPLALAGDRLLARDLTRMVCLDVGEH